VEDGSEGCGVTEKVEIAEDNNKARVGAGRRNEGVGGVNSQNRK
jgi:hypothetical protein